MAPHWATNTEANTQPEPLLLPLGSSPQPGPSEQLHGPGLCSRMLTTCTRPESTLDHRCQCHPNCRPMMANSHELSAQINTDLGRKLMRTARRPSGKCPTNLKGLQGSRLGLAHNAKWSRPKACQKALYWPGAHGANSTIYSTPWGAHPGSSGLGLPCPWP